MVMVRLMMGCLFVVALFQQQQNVGRSCIYMSYNTNPARALE